MSLSRSPYFYHLGEEAEGIKCSGDIPDYFDIDHIHKHITVLNPSRVLRKFKNQLSRDFLKRNYIVALPEVI